MDRHGSHSQQEAMIDLVMTSPTLDSQQQGPSQMQENYHPPQQQHRQGRPVNGESDHGPLMMISPDTSPRIERIGAMDRSTKSDVSEAALYGQGGLMTTVNETGGRSSERSERTEGFRMETGVGGMKEKYHPLAGEHSKESMGTEALAAELRINEPHM